MNLHVRISESVRALLPRHSLRKLCFSQDSVRERISYNRVSWGLLWLRPKIGKALYGHYPGPGEDPHTHAQWDKCKRKIPFPPCV